MSEFLKIKKHISLNLNIDLKYRCFIFYFKAIIDYYSLSFSILHYNYKPW